MYKGYEVASNAINTILSEQKQGQRQCYLQKSWRWNTITHGP